MAKRCTYKWLFLVQFFVICKKNVLCDLEFSRGKSGGWIASAETNVREQRPGWPPGSPVHWQTRSVQSGSESEVACHINEAAPSRDPAQLTRAQRSSTAGHTHTYTHAHTHTQHTTDKHLLQDFHFLSSLTFPVFLILLLLYFYFGVIWVGLKNTSHTSIYSFTIRDKNCMVIALKY